MSSNETAESSGEVHGGTAGASSDDDSCSSNSENDSSCPVPRRIRNILALQHSSRVKELERHMLSLMSKGPQSQRDAAKASFDARLDALTQQHTLKLHEAINAASSASPNTFEKLPDLSDDISLDPRVRIAREKRQKSSKKRAEYCSRRIYKEMRLLFATNDPDFSGVTKMIRNSAANLEYHVDKGRTLLLAAANMGMHEVIASLLQAGARVDAQDEHHRCALVIVASRNCSASFGSLVDHMNHAMIACDQVESCMQHAISFSNLSIARCILRHVQITKSHDFRRILDWSLIAAAAAADDVMLQLFLQQGATANAVDNLRRSALMHAVASKVGILPATHFTCSHCICRPPEPMFALECC
jgi:hypothetical protein